MEEVHGSQSKLDILIGKCVDSRGKESNIGRGTWQGAREKFRILTGHCRISVKSGVERLEIMNLA